jgi:ribosome-binding protein aMBF1 (putative translation factor)
MNIMLARRDVSVCLARVAEINDKPGEAVSGSEIDRHLGRRISEARNQREQSQYELAKTIDVDVDELNSVESGEVRVASLLLARVARALDLPLSWFFDGLPGQDVFDAPRSRRSV